MPPTAPLVVCLLAASLPRAGSPVSSRTLVLALEVDRDRARLVAFTAKERAFNAYPETGLEPLAGRDERGQVQLEVSLLGPAGAVVRERVTVGPLCLDHDGDTPAHLEGDTVLAHRDTFLVELPDLAGFDQVQVGWPGGDPSRPGTGRTFLGREALDPERFLAAGGALGYSELAVAGGRAEDGAPETPTRQAVQWPEQLGDPDIYRVWGDEGETAERINLVILPEGYTYEEKDLLESHAGELVSDLRRRTPLREHDRFLNYVLVYAYSTRSGTDECDCGLPVETAFNTRFPDAGYGCETTTCLYYGTLNGGPACDPETSAANIGAAELRAPAADRTIVMVNTARYGGCTGSRSVYSAGHPEGLEIAAHELGHLLARLADEYGGWESCGAGSGPNASTNPSVGGWPEWIDELGAPREGARYYDRCVFRPEDECTMRELGRPYCAVCRQHWALSIFDHRRVKPTAPVARQDPPSPVAARIGERLAFRVETRLPEEPAGSDLTWEVREPGAAAPEVAAAGGASFEHLFDRPGTYTVTLTAVAGTSFIKPARHGPNRDVASWTVNVRCDPPPGFAGVREVVDLDGCAASGLEVRWDPATFGPGGGTYEVWRDGGLVAGALGAPPFADRPGDSLSHAYQVVAVSADCGHRAGSTSGASAADLAAPAELPPLGNVLVAVKSASGVALQWPPGAGAQGYQVVRSAGRAFQPPYAPVGPGTTATAGLEDTDAPGEEGVYAYRVAVSACGVTSGF